MKITFFYKVAGLLGVFVFFALVFVSSAQESAESGKNLFLDFDQDGLSNDEETAYGTDPYSADTDKDGYSDYTEISGGYNPLKPAPGDKLVVTPQSVKDETLEGDEGSNMTEEVGAKIAGVIQSNMSENKEVALADIDQVIQESVTKSMEAPKFSEVNSDRLKILKQTYKDMSDEEREEAIKQDAEEYITAVSYIFAVQFPDLVNLADESQGFSSFEGLITRSGEAFLAGDFTEIDALSASGEKATEQLYEVEVPETLVDLHIRGIQFALYIQELKNNAKKQSGDPLENISNLSLLQGLLVAGQDFVTDAEKRLTDLGLESMISNVL